MDEIQLNAGPRHRNPYANSSSDNEVSVLLTDQFASEMLKHGTSRFARPKHFVRPTYSTTMTKACNKFIECSLCSLADDEIRIDNPLLHWRPSEVDRKARQFARDHDLRNQEGNFVKAARILRDPEAWQSVPNLTADEKQALETERSNGFWQQPKELKVTVRLTSPAAKSAVC